MQQAISKKKRLQAEIIPMMVPSPRLPLKKKQ
jgi:hypothetical protein